MLLLPLAPNARGEQAAGEPTPSPHVVNGAVVWSPVGAESSYEVAVSSTPGGAPDRASTYLRVQRVPGETQAFRPVLAAGDTEYVGVSADGGLRWSSPEVAVTVSSGRAPPARSRRVRHDRERWRKARARRWSKTPRRRPAARRRAPRLRRGTKPRRARRGLPTRRRACARRPSAGAC